MASSTVSTALIPWDPNSDRAVVPQEESESEGRWALLRSALSSPSPGRTLNELYSSLGKVLETQANRAAHKLGLGPHVVAHNIKSDFGDGDKRFQQLMLLRTSASLKLRKLCNKLMKYALPTESAKTQCQAFRNIVDITTLLPDLRAHLISAECMGGATTMDSISALWARSVGSPVEGWTFWQTLAATSLSDPTISLMLEDTSILQLTKCEEGGLSVIERLLIERDCSHSAYDI
ncbi:hypothetical protein B0H19DRAFT_1079820 [Mycena capillaripes]|nr:hypothetical protein B0H19DRAFT_1079820 [Mycena capillaripes]